MKIWPPISCLSHGYPKLPNVVPWPPDRPCSRRDLYPNRVGNVNSDNGYEFGSALPIDPVRRRRWTWGRDMVLFLARRIPCSTNSEMADRVGQIDDSAVARRPAHAKTDSGERPPCSGAKNTARERLSEGHMSRADPLTLHSRSNATRMSLTCSVSMFGRIVHYANEFLGIRRPEGRVDCSAQLFCEALELLRIDKIANRSSSEQVLKRGLSGIR